MKKLLSILLAVCMCLFIGKTLMDFYQAHEHTYETEWSKDETNHWHACNGEDCTTFIDKASHTWDEGKITSTATLTEDGVKTFTCSVCDATKRESYSLNTTIADASVWATAMDCGDNFTMTGQVFVSGLVAQSCIMERNGNRIKTTQIAGLDISIRYESIEGNSFYRYESTSHHNGYTKMNVTSFYESADEFTADWNPLSFAYGNMNDFTYNLQNKRYEAASMISNGQEAKNVWISFIDGKAVSMGYTTIIDSIEGICEFIITYNTASEIILPTTTNIILP